MDFSAINENSKRMSSSKTFFTATEDRQVEPPKQQLLLAPSASLSGQKRKFQMKGGDHSGAVHPTSSQQLDYNNNNNSKRRHLNNHHQQISNSSASIDSLGENSSERLPLSSAVALSTAYSAPVALPKVSVSNSDKHDDDDGAMASTSAGMKRKRDVESLSMPVAKKNKVVIKSKTVANSSNGAAEINPSSDRSKLRLKPTVIAVVAIKHRPIVAVATHRKTAAIRPGSTSDHLRRKVVPAAINTTAIKLAPLKIITVQKKQQATNPDLLASIFDAQKKLFDKTSDSVSSGEELPAASVAKYFPISAVTITQQQKTIALKPPNAAAADHLRQKETPGVAIKSALPEAIVQPNRQAKNRDLLLGSIFTAQKMETNRYSTLASSASKPSAAAAQKVEISIPFEGEKALRIQHQRRQEQERRRRLHLEIMVRDQSSSAVTSLMKQFDDKFSSMTPLERRQFVEAKMNIADHIYC
jgi:hypothetical protein